MKKMSKRFFTLVMALVMALSCTAFASAAEVSEEVSDDMQYVVMTFNEEGMSVETTTELPSTLSARSTSKDFVNVVRNNVASGSRESSSFTYPGTGSLVVAFAATGDGVGCLDISSKDYNMVFYSDEGQVKSDAFYGMSGPQTVRWELYAAGGSLSRAAIIISGVYN